MFRRIFCAVAAAVIALSLAACSSDESAPEGPAFGKVAVEDAFDNWQRVAGKQYKHLKMPEVIVPQQITKAYKIDFNLLAPQVDREKLRKVFKDFLGDSFSDKPQDIGDGGVVYPPIEGKRPAGSGTYQRDGFFTMAFELEPSEYTDPNSPENKNYTVSAQGDTVIEFAGKTTTVAQKAEMIGNKINEALGNIFGPYSYAIHQLTVTPKEITANGGLVLEGIPFQYIGSKYSKNLDDKFATETDYACNVFSYIGEKDDILWIGASGIPTFMGKTELDSIIPIERAAELADRGVGDESFEIADVKLMYCALIEYPKRAADGTFPPEYDTRGEIRTLEPTWCFILEKEHYSDLDEFVKVNALTGEVKILIGSDDREQEIVAK